MNAIVPIPEASGAVSWHDATRAVNAWRGSLLHSFAEAEAAVSETLLTLAQDAKLGASIKLRPLVGQRFEDLRVAIAPEGVFAREGTKAFQALESFRSYDSLRHTLCHGKAKICLDRHGQWVAVFQVLAFRAQKPERSTTVFEQGQSEEIERDVRRHVQRLVSALRQLTSARGQSVPLLAN